MAVWSTSRLSVSEVNTLITIASMIVGYCMSLMLAAVSLEMRRLMIVRGKGDAILQDAGYGAMWTAWKQSASRSRTFLVVLPVLMGYAASTVIEFTTSGISASIGFAEGGEITVVGLAGNGIADYLPSFPSIEQLVEDVENRTEFESGYISLLSPELELLGFSSNFLGFEVVPTYYENYDGKEGVYVSGNRYTPPLNVSLSYCLEIAALEEGAFSFHECREHLIVERTQRHFHVLNQTDETVVSQECEDIVAYVALGNQGVSIVARNLTLESGVNVTATCGSIYESITESCIWKDSDILYVGDWNIRYAGLCTNVTFPGMAIVGVAYEAEVEQGGDAASILVAMTAEIFSGTGLLSSRQQLVKILAAIVRLECMVWGVQQAYAPVEVVEIGISLWIPLVLFLSLLLPGLAWGFVKCKSGRHFFLPVSPAEWSACAARELDGDAGSWCTVSPPEKYYDQVYAFGPASTDERDVVSQRLRWVSKQAVSPAITCADQLVYASGGTCVKSTDVERPPTVSVRDQRFVGDASSAVVSQLRLHRKDVVRR